MTHVSKDFPFTITYLDDINIFTRTTEEHLDHIRQSLKIMECSVINEAQQMLLLCKRNPVPWTHTQHHGLQTTTIQNASHQ